MNDKTMLTTKETADYLRVSPSTIYRMTKQSLLKFTSTPSGQRLFSKKDFLISETPLVYSNAFSV